MEENRQLSADLDILKQQYAELESDQGCWLKVQRLAEEALQAERKRLMTFSLEARAVLEAAVTKSVANPKVHCFFLHKIKLSIDQLRAGKFHLFFILHLPGLSLVMKEDSLPQKVANLL